MNVPWMSAIVLLAEVGYKKTECLEDKCMLLREMIDCV